MRGKKGIDEEERETERGKREYMRGKKGSRSEGGKEKGGKWN